MWSIATRARTTPAGSGSRTFTSAGGTRPTWVERRGGAIAGSRSGVYGRINSRELRDREVAYEHGTAPRILVLGDSFTEAFQVEQEQTFERLLAERLGIEVVNAGDSGFGTDNALLFFLAEGWKYRPDLVVLMFNTSNDILENDNTPLLGTKFPYPDKPYFELTDGRLERRHYPLRRWAFAARFRRRATSCCRGTRHSIGASRGCGPR